MSLAPPVRLILALSACCTLLPGRALSDPPPGYYDTVDPSTPETLRQTLHLVIEDHQWFPYSSSSTDTWDILEEADENPEDANAIVDLYRNGSIAKFGGGNGPYNREHVWPKSYGFPDNVPENYPYTDCHHLFLCNPGYNSDRGNKPFEDCGATSTERTTILTNGRGGSGGGYPGDSNWFDSGSWETWSGRRGDVARAILYMDIRYEGGVHGVSGEDEPDLIATDDRALIASGSTGNNEPIAYMGLLSTLRQWHLEDPVDDIERYRNDVVYVYQGNRNPFIDHPEWVGQLEVSSAPTSEPWIVGLEQNYPNPFDNRTTIEYEVARVGFVQLHVISAQGRHVATLAAGPMAPGRNRAVWLGTNDRNEPMPSGVYFYRLSAPGVEQTKRMLFLR